MTLGKGSTVKLLIVAFILFLVFKPEKSKQVYEQVMAQLNQANFSSKENDEQRLKTVVEKANKILDKNEEELKNAPPPEPKSECKCGGTGQIVHGDGHKTPCTCDEPCKCEKPKSMFGDEEKKDLQTFIESAVQKSFDNYVKEYREKAAAAASANVQPQPQTQGQIPQ